MVAFLISAADAGISAFSLSASEGPIAWGDCIASYRYPMLIDHGVLANGGAIALNVSGRVAPSGVVKVVVSSGDKSATGYGRLAGNTGGGSWTGASCSGSWSAERRS